MRTRMQLLLLTFIAAFAREAKLTDANVLFRFALNFHVKSDDSAENEGVINKTLIFENNHITVENNLNKDESIGEDITERPDDLVLVTTTTGPHRSTSDFWLQEQNLTREIDMKLKEVVWGLTKLNQEISPVVRSSDFILSKVNLITRYLNIWNASAAGALNTNTTTRISDNGVQSLQQFIKLVSQLREPPSDINGGLHTIEYLVMKLALEKYQITQLQAEVEEQLAVAVLAWQQYVKTKTVEITV